MYTYFSSLLSGHPISHPIPLLKVISEHWTWAPCDIEHFSTDYLTFYSVQSLRCGWLFVTPWSAALQASCPSPTPGWKPKLCPLSRWCHPTILSSITPFSSCPQPFPASESFSVSQFFASGGQNIGASALASVFPMNIQGWFHLGLTGLISLQSKGLSRVFSNTTIQKHQLFNTQPSLWSNSRIHTWVLEKP